MIKVSELKDICEEIEREYGADSNVIIQYRNDNGSLVGGGYLIDVFRDSAGSLYLTNHKFKHGSCE